MRRSLEIQGTYWYYKKTRTHRDSH